MFARHASGRMAGEPLVGEPMAGATGRCGAYFLIPEMVRRQNGAARN